MKFDADDPKLTAYALNELDAAERSEIEALLANDEGARKSVEEIRASAGALEKELKREKCAGLSDEQHRAIEARLAAPPVRVRFAFWKPLAVAASLLFVVGIVGWMMASSGH